jgi:hypothetical protein
VRRFTWTCSESQAGIELQCTQCHVTTTCDSDECDADDKRKVLDQVAYMRGFSGENIDFIGTRVVGSKTRYTLPFLLSQLAVPLNKKK